MSSARVHQRGETGRGGTPSRRLLVGGHPAATWCLRVVWACVLGALCLATVLDGRRLFDSSYPPTSALSAVLHAEALIYQKVAVFDIPYGTASTLRSRCYLTNPEVSFPSSTSSSPAWPEPSTGEASSTSYGFRLLWDMIFKNSSPPQDPELVNMTFGTLLAQPKQPCIMQPYNNYYYVLTYEAFGMASGGEIKVNVGRVQYLTTDFKSYINLFVNDAAGETDPGPNNTLPNTTQPNTTQPDDPVMDNPEKHFFREAVRAQPWNLAQKPSTVPQKTISAIDSELPNVTVRGPNNTEASFLLGVPRSFFEYISPTLMRYGFVDYSGPDPPTTTTTTTSSTTSTEAPPSEPNTETPSTTATLSDEAPAAHRDGSTTTVYPPYLPDVANTTVNLSTQITSGYLRSEGSVVLKFFSQDTWARLFQRSVSNRYASGTDAGVDGGDGGGFYSSGAWSSLGGDAVPAFSLCYAPAVYSVPLVGPSFTTVSEVIHYEYKATRMIPVIVQCSNIPVSFEVTLEMTNENGFGSSADYIFSVLYYCFAPGYVALFIVFLVTLVYNGSQAEHSQHYFHRMQRTIHKQVEEEKQLLRRPALKVEMVHGLRSKRPRTNTSSSRRPPDGSGDGNEAFHCGFTSDEARDHSDSQSGTPRPRRHRLTSITSDTGGGPWDEREAASLSSLDQNELRRWGSSTARRRAAEARREAGTAAPGKVRQRHSRSAKSADREVDIADGRRSASPPPPRPDESAASGSPTLKPFRRSRCGIRDGARHNWENLSATATEPEAPGNVFVAFGRAVRLGSRALCGSRLTDEQREQLMYPPLKWALCTFIPIKCVGVILSAANYSLRSRDVVPSVALTFISSVISKVSMAGVTALEMLITLGWGLAVEQVPLFRIVFFIVVAGLRFIVESINYGCLDVNVFTRAPLPPHIGKRCAVMPYVAVLLTLTVHAYNIVQLIRLRRRLERRAFTNFVPDLPRLRRGGECEGWGIVFDALHGGAAPRDRDQRPTPVEEVSTPRLPDEGCVTPSALDRSSSSLFSSIRSPRFSRWAPRRSSESAGGLPQLSQSSSPHQRSPDARYRIPDEDNPDGGEGPAESARPPRPMADTELDAGTALCGPRRRCWHVCLRQPPFPRLPPLDVSEAYRDLHSHHTARHCSSQPSRLRYRPRAAAARHQDSDGSRSPSPVPSGASTRIAEVALRATGCMSSVCTTPCFGRSCLLSSGPS
eukprot:gene8574-6015_t